MANRPESELAITQDLVQALLDEQAPEFAERPLRELSRGWDNTNWLVGDDAIVRIPHRKVAVDLIRHEQAWLPVVQRQVDLAIPAPIHTGVSTSFFPWPWSITPFFVGTEAASAGAIDHSRTAQILARFYRELHTPAPADAPVNRFRGVPLASRAETFTANLRRLDEEFDQARLRAIFDAACSAETTTERVWLHGDLHSRNMIVQDGELVAVIDWGDICSGDRATDLAGAFMLVPDELELVEQHAGASPAAWQRARGWAVHFAVVYLAHSDDDPVMGAIGRRLVDVLTADQGPR